MSAQHLNICQDNVELFGGEQLQPARKIRDTLNDGRGLVRACQFLTEIGVNVRINDYRKSLVAVPIRITRNHYQRPDAHLAASNSEPESHLIGSIGKGREKVYSGGSLWLPTYRGAGLAEARDVFFAYPSVDATCLPS